MDTSPTAPLRVAYLINRYPAGSHTFIRREIEALERQGVSVQRIALRKAEAQLVDADDCAEATRTRYVLAQGPVRLLMALVNEVNHEKLHEPASGAPGRRVARI